MIRTLPLLAGLAVVILTGLVHGCWTQRWQPSQALTDAVARLERVPLRIGEWQGHPQEVDDESYARAGAAGYWLRRYVHLRSGQAVSVILMCGRAGPMAVHAPDVCYRSAGFEVVAGPEPYRVSGPAGPHEWRALWVRQPGPVPVALRVIWAWSANGDWRAPDHPRLVFRGAPALYKLYLLREMTRADAGTADDPCPEFLSALLPELRQTLFPPAAP
jgi:hypothetical protein